MEFGHSDWGDFVSRYTRQSQLNRTPSPSPQHLLPEFESEFQNISPTNLGSLWSSEKKFCSEDNLDQCLAYLNQELSILGYPSLFIQSQSKSGPLKSFNIVHLVNCTFELLEHQQQNMRIRGDLEARQSRSVCDNDNLLQNMKRIKEQHELAQREVAVAGEKHKKQHKAIGKLKENLKAEKEEVKRTKFNMQHLQKQCDHDMRKKEGEMSKLKERLRQLLTDKTQEKRMGMEIINPVQKVGGKRKTWNTAGLALESDVSRVLISSYEERQKELMVENNMLRESLRDMQSELMNLLNPQNESIHSDSEVGYSSDEGSSSVPNGHYHLPFESARERIEESWKEKCRVLREILDNNKSSSSEGGTPRSEGEASHHGEENAKLKQQVENYKHITEQQEVIIESLQQQNSKESWALVDESQLCGEKMSLQEEKKLFKEQQAAFEKERNTFTMTAIQLERERKKFEEERASFFKQQLLTPKPVTSSQSIQSTSSTCSSGSRTIKSLSGSGTHTPVNNQLQMSVSDPILTNQNEDLCRRLSAGKEKGQVLNDHQHNSPEMCSSLRTPFNHLTNSGPIRTPTTAELYKTLSLELEKNSNLLETPKRVPKENNLNNFTMTDNGLSSLRDADRFNLTRSGEREHTPRRLLTDTTYLIEPNYLEMPSLHSSSDVDDEVDISQGDRMREHAENVHQALVRKSLESGGPQDQSLSPESN